jgi:hypothetical protein
MDFQPNPPKKPCNAKSAIAGYLVTTWERLKLSQTARDQQNLQIPDETYIEIVNH